MSDSRTTFYSRFGEYDEPVGQFTEIVWCKTHDSSVSHGLCLWLEVTEEQMVYRGPKCELVKLWIEIPDPSHD